MSTRAPGRGAVRARAAPQRADRVRVRVIPYDHVATFDLTGQPGNVHQDVINVGVEGLFVAVAIGYGLEEAVTETVPIDGENAAPVDGVTLEDFPSYALLDGMRLNPALEPIVFRNSPTVADFSTFTIQEANDLGLFQTIRRARPFSFLFNIVDSGTGRELQNAPIHSIAGLGKANGERPFRVLAQPLSFLPRSSIRVEVEEQTRGVSGRLHVALHGYNILGAAGVAHGELRALDEKLERRAGLRPSSFRLLDRLEEGRIPSRRIVPFDYARSFRLEGRPGRIVEEEINVNVEGKYVATGVGYGFVVADSEVVLRDIRLDVDSVPVGGMSLSQFPSEVLRGGFRIRDSLHRLAFNPFTGELASLRPDVVANLFEPVNSPDRVQFLYSIEDTGTGRAWQDRPVHNIAGLGIANGDRPFRRWAYPADFLPRSTIRVRVEEIFGRGQLHLVFQGYKILDGSS